jgi:hypothetical protein
MLKTIGYLADFETGYLQRALPLHQATIAGGIDESVHDATVKGFAVRRLVKIVKSADNTYTITAPITGVGALIATTFTGAKATMVAAGIGDATHIIAQSDNSLHNQPGDFIKAEQYNTQFDDIAKNEATDKLVSVYKITNADDIKLIDVDSIARTAS